MQARHPKIEKIKKIKEETNQLIILCTWGNMLKGAVFGSAERADAVLSVLWVPWPVGTGISAIAGIP
jgi:hypothetical protein